MKPWFVLSYPRSRTAWLAAYLTGAGVFSFHEAWRQVKTTRQLRSLMESKTRHDWPVVNVDCANWFFADELAAEFPDARFIRITRPWEEVERDARQSFGNQHDYPWIKAAYDRAMARAPVYSSLSIDFDKWTPAESIGIYDHITGGRFNIDPDWHRQAHDFWIQLTPDAIQAELGAGTDGRLMHIHRRMAR